MIDIQDLHFSYTKAPFVRDMTFHVNRGEIFGFLGPSGAGKSTLQKLMTAQLTPNSGSVRIFSEEVTRQGPRFYERIGIDFEFPCLYEKLTARQNLAFFASLYKDAHPDIDALLACVELSRDADKRVAAYSKGMKSRLGFLRALVNDPDVLFLDEPTGGLDPTNARLMKDMILQEKARGKTVILTTHNMQDAQELCDRVAFIVNGEIKALDTPHALTMRKGAGVVRYSWLEDGAEQAAECPMNETGADERLCTLLRDGRLLTIHSAEPNLGDIFIELTGRALE